MAFTRRERAEIGEVFERDGSYVAPDLFSRDEAGLYKKLWAFYKSKLCCNTRRF